MDYLFTGSWDAGRVVGIPVKDGQTSLYSLYKTFIIYILFKLYIRTYIEIIRIKPMRVTSRYTCQKDGMKSEKF